MKPFKENICSDPLHSFRVSYSVQSFFDSPWHFHHEYELFYIIKGEGLQFVGDNISEFSDGQMVFLGKDLPHYWKSPAAYYENNPDLTIEAICVQFSESAFGENFFDLTEMSRIKRFLTDSQTGFIIEREAYHKIVPLLWELVESSGIKRFTLLIEILEILSSTNQYFKTISSRQFKSRYNHPSQARLNKVFEYIIQNFKTDIQLETVADIAGMSKSAFCRFFKSTTLKTLVEYVNQLKINYSCSLLLNTDLNISQISYETGFKTPSYFIKTFKSITGLTPIDYKKQLKPSKTTHEKSKSKKLSM